MFDFSLVKISHSYFFLIVAIAFGLLAGCGGLPIKEGGISKPVRWSALRGWGDDQHAQAWPALKQSCEKLAARDAAWQDICNDVEALGMPSDETARAFFENHFVPHRVVGQRGRKGLITGYYEPLLNGSLERTERFRYPLYRRPPNLLTIDLGDVYPALKGRRVRGRLQGTRVVPYFSRAEIDGGEPPLAGHELAWVDDPVSLFFLHIQGSGRLQLPDGRILAVGYADQNGHPYVSIGRQLLEAEALEVEEITLGSIRDWIVMHPDQTKALLHSNPSYVFFTVRNAELPGPLGTLNVPLTAERSIAVDRKFISLGLPVWLDTTLAEQEQPYRRLVFAQDTGGAIKGAVRADV
ncbi:MAG: murein transglycosylase A, partial [Acidiferrobacterales bacterium]